MHRDRCDRILTGVVVGLAAAAAAVLLLVVAFVLQGALPALRSVGLDTLVFDDVWQPEQGKFGARPMLVGSALVVLGALALAVPIGVASAIFVHFYAAPALGRWHRRLVELLAGIPSVIVGLWGLVHLVPRVAAWHPPGASLAAGALVLATMILPTIALTADAALATVPRSTLLGAAALGLGRATTALRIALPAARHGIVSGVVLAAGRAVGETMAVLMVCGNVVQLPGSVFDPVRTVTANIALEMGYATPEHRAVLFATGLLLTLTVAGLVALGVATTRGHRVR